MSQKAGLCALLKNNAHLPIENLREFLKAFPRLLSNLAAFFPNCSIMYSSCRKPNFSTVVVPTKY